ncbi:FAD-dependent monooxygenase [Sphingomonas sp. H39-1-10]|uniref:FAD-dependent oxidoreductase n=1 Tax=Sphingomonas pollutisoli TaxID=3030829 RepID=UPI0023B92228|nr:FAD-dependent monooxygenase [Sphingomonas pollutisoli]MDF0488475.1 FAD-dependent monooxygenase [Sphingomonas pollutisoli]
MTIDPRIAIIGGGPGGLMLARLLHLRGLAPVVFERDADADARPQGGSLDLHSDTGQHAMRAAGLEDAFRTHARPEDQGDRLYDADGTLLFDRDGAGDDRPEIDRSALRRILLESVPPGMVRWNSGVEAIRLGDAGHMVVSAAGAEAFDVVVGADGGWSKVRALLGDARPRYEGAVFVELGFDTRRHPQVDALVGAGKMFAVGDNRALIGQRNGNGHIRGYAGWRIDEADARALGAMPPEAVRAAALAVFEGWSPMLRDMIVSGDPLGVRPLYALPIGHRWASVAGVTLLGDAAHLMSPFAGEGVNLALADAVDLAAALTSGAGWPAIARYEAAMVARAVPAAQAAARGMAAVLSGAGAAPMLDHYRARLGG